MSETFQKVLITDDRIAGCTNAVKYAVMKGGQNCTSTSYSSISQSPAQQVFNVAVPSLETIISREVLWSSTITLRIEGNNKPANQYLINYGVTDALAPFPLHALVGTMTCNINNNTVAMNMSEVLPAILRLCDPEELAHFTDLTPTSLDYLGDYRDGVAPMEFTIGRVENAAGGAATARPAIFDVGANAAVVDNAFRGTASQSFMSFPSNVLGYDSNRMAGSSKTHRPRGSYRIMGMWAVDGGGARRVPTVGDNVVFVQFRVTEPILMSPFTFGTPAGKQGFYGIQALNFQMNMIGNANRAWRCACHGANYSKSATVVAVEESLLRFQFITPHASQLLDSRNVVPYYELPTYRTINLQAFPGRGNGEIIQAGDPRGPAGTFFSSPSVTINSSNIQLNGIPDKIVVFVRRTAANLTCGDADRYLTINNCRINFNNQAGLLSSMTPEQLYTNSVLSGLQNMTYDEFRGLTVSVGGRDDGVSARRQPFTGEGSSLLRAAAAGPPAVLLANSAGFKYIATTGTILVLNFAEVIQLTDEYYSPGSLGTFNLQIQLEVQNNHADDWPANTAEMVIMPINSGVFVNERGTSSTFLSLLTKADVLATLEQPTYTNFEIRRMIGGGSFTDRLHSALHWIGQKAQQALPYIASAAKTAMASSGNPYGTAGAAALTALGYGRGNHRALSDRTNG